MFVSLLVVILAADPTPQQVELLKTFQDEFVEITPGEGTFLEAVRLGPDQKTGPEVTLGKAFKIAKYEVPQNLWEAVMGDNPSKWKGKRNSVEMLSFEDARQFCAKATELMQAAQLIEPSEAVHLPSEAEWEYCARAGTTTTYSFGNDVKLLNDYGWHTGNAAGNDPPVGAKKPNRWGLYDMHGYLWEWTEASQTAGKVIVRGGSWKDRAEDLTSSSRREVEANLRDDAVGLRCVLVQAPGLPAPTRRSLSSANIVITAVAPSEFAPTAQATVVPEGSQLEQLWGEGQFTEGPALAPDGSILFSDIGTTIYRFDPKSGQTRKFRDPSGRSNGLKFNQQGALIACEGANTGGNRRISITTGIDGAKDGTVKSLADKFDGKRFNSPNDLAIDPQGNVYFTDPRYVGDDPRDLDYECVFLVTPNGGVKIATRDVQKPNGIIVTADGKTAYVSDNNPQGNRQLTAFAIKSDGTLTDKRVLHDFGTGRGIDGMTLARDGNIFATAGTGDKAGIYVFSPAGKHLAFIPTPGDPTNCCFGGGSDNSTLYITSANSKEAGAKYGLFRIRLNAQGYHVVKLK
jgi:gluconolactonase